MISVNNFHSDKKTCSRVESQQENFQNFWGMKDFKVDIKKPFDISACRNYLTSVPVNLHLHRPMILKKRKPSTNLRISHFRGKTPMKNVGILLKILRSIASFMSKQIGSSATTF